MNKYDFYRQVDEAGEKDKQLNEHLSADLLKSAEKIINKDLCIYERMADE